MAKSKCTLTPPFDQDRLTVYHHGKQIDDPDFDFEDSFCRRLNKLHGIADMFSNMGESGERQFTPKGCFGICNTLEDVAKELWAICYTMLENQEVKHAD